MRFLSVAERELRAAARQKKTYRLRWIVAAGAFALLLWLGWAFDVFANRSTGPMVFQVCSVILFLACRLIGAADTADCISREKREGTLGLLFLTNLNSAEIVAGKLCSNGLALIYPLLATFPILSLPVLIGGITFGQFWRTVLALASAVFFAMAAGFTASALGVRQVPAVAVATGLALLFGMGLSGVAALIRHWGYPAALADTVAAFSPFRSLTAAGNNPRLLLSDHTNAIRRIVLAHVETWRAYPEAKAQPTSVPQAGGVYVRRREWAWQPRTWWYDNCRQIYRAGQNAMARVDAAAGRLSDDIDWRDVHGLPLYGDTSQLFHQASWWGGTPMLVSFAQTAANQALIACALERYRAAHGAYPETLDQLLPAWLDRIPRDISRGAPMFYQRDDKDSYVLRGAGQNGTIDQGTVPSDDWLWSFTSPATNAPAGATKRK